MAKYKVRRQERYEELRDSYLTRLEARELSKLARKTPALRLLVQDRIARYERFYNLAANKVYRGRWRPSDVPGKWLANLARLYSKKRWRVQFGATGEQQPMPKSNPNPWAMYRDYERITPDKGYVSPWELKQISKGKTPLQKGLIFVQKTEKQMREGGISKSTIALWLEQKKEAIKSARGKRRTQLVIESRRLEKLL